MFLISQNQSLSKSQLEVCCPTKDDLCAFPGLDWPHTTIAVGQSNRWVKSQFWVMGHFQLLVSSSFPFKLKHSFTLSGPLLLFLLNATKINSINLAHGTRCWMVTDFWEGGLLRHLKTHILVGSGAQEWQENYKNRTGELWDGMNHFLNFGGWGQWLWASTYRLIPGCSLVELNYLAPHLPGRLLMFWPVSLNLHVFNMGGL